MNSKTMLKEVRKEVQENFYLTGVRELSKKTYEALEKVPRHLFVDEAYKNYAYVNKPLPIGYKQTISQPYIVSLMTELLDIKPHHRVLEIGTGSGYQAALLSVLAQDIYTIEIIAPLAHKAKETLREHGYTNVHVKVADGFTGWPEEGPFDRIIITAAIDPIPKALLDSLTENGILIAPIGSYNSSQMLTKIMKTKVGLQYEEILPVIFVPFTGKASERREKLRAFM